MKTVGVRHKCWVRFGDRGGISSWTSHEKGLGVGLEIEITPAGTNPLHRGDSVVAVVFVFVLALALVLTLVLALALALVPLHPPPPSPPPLLPPPPTPPVFFLVHDQSNVVANSTQSLPDPHYSKTPTSLTGHWNGLRICRRP